MNEPEIHYPNPPIVEAVLDIECDMPPGQEIATLEVSARDSFRDRYPTFRKGFIHEHQFETAPDTPPKVSVLRHGINALQFFSEDAKQLVQVRSQGFAYNRLAPYTRLDDYLPEIERTWNLFVDLASPVKISLIRLRYINRMLLPMEKGRITLGDYLHIAPRLPSGDEFTFTGFLHQNRAVEVSTGHQINFTLTTEAGDNESLPLIFDNGVSATDVEESLEWASILCKLNELRSLKNKIFKQSLTDKCLNLFQ